MIHKCKDCGDTDLKNFGIRSSNQKPYNFCRPCRNARSLETRRKYSQRPEVKIKKKSADKKYAHRNRERLKEYHKEYHMENRDILLEKKREYYSQTKEHHLKKCADWKKQNKGLVNKSCADRRARKLKASPAWGDLNSFIIEEAYSLASDRSKLTGTTYHVDHIIPLNNSKVCGLHVGINLQVILAAENLQKSNKL